MRQSQKAVSNRALAFERPLLAIPCTDPKAYFTRASIAVDSSSCQDVAKRVVKDRLSAYCISLGSSVRRRHRYIESPHAIPLVAVVSLSWAW